MSDESQLLLGGESTTPPEQLDWETSIAGLAQEAVYKSSGVDIRESIGHPRFKTTYLVLKQDIFDQTINRQRRFVEECLEKIEAVYDFRFPEDLDIADYPDVIEFLEFLEFLEYDNIEFLSNVWRMMDVDLLKLDIESFCNMMVTKIIKETEEQLESRDDGQMITTFLRTYYKDKFIEWFINNTEKSKIEVILEIRQ